MNISILKSKNFEIIFSLDEVTAVYMTRKKDKLNVPHQTYIKKMKYNCYTLPMLPLTGLRC